ncbi:MAG: peptidoglycan DD-metalloendopeptidase family protein [Oscillospiraceae bacterium]|nr:peptidoglycan DD-metalloendopeptidase family protein [Oscillospiraceae bacterium]
MRKSTKRLAMVLALILAGMLLLSVVISVIMNAVTAEAATKLDNLKEEQKRIAADKKRITEKLADTKRERKSIINQKFALDEQIAIIEQEIDNTVQLIQEYTVQIARTQESIAAATADIADKEDRFLRRMRAMEEAGDISYISILMQAHDFADLLGRISIISDIAAADRKVIAELQAARDEIISAREQLEAEKVEQQRSKQELADAQSELANQYKELDKLMAELEADEKELLLAEDEADKEMAKLQAAIAAEIAEQQRRNRTQYVGGSMAWPAPEWTRLSSEYGNRIHPILKVNRFHSGVDLAAPTGSPILAANSGTVLKAEWNGGYGNCVVIDHGGGVATLYAHASRILVKKGQNVTKGDRIALIGSTGTSTGPHLHFEVLIDGKTENPLQSKYIGTVR